DQTPFVPQPCQFLPAFEDQLVLARLNELHKYVFPNAKGVRALKRKGKFSHHFFAIKETKQRNEAKKLPK
ncbi:MAG: hypothetical protein Q9M19_00525, partial [Mariprofundaceae bacterium]|nr:hypothetical protein [Mariprofundaceae bacterium]